MHASDDPKPALSTSSRPIWATIGLVAFLLLVVGGGVALKVIRERNLAKQRADQAAIAKLEAESAAARQAIAAEYEQTGEVSAEHQDKLIKNMEAMGKATGGDLEKLTSSVSVIAREWADLSTKYTDFVDTFSKAGGLQLDSLDSLEKIDGRIAIVLEGRRWNDEITRSVRGGSDRLEKMLLDKGFTPKRAQEDAAVAAEKWGTLLEMRAIQSRFLSSCMDYLTILREQWGAWQIDPNSGQVVFEKTEAIDQFNDAAQRVQKASEEEAQWMKNYAK
jgi:hypothetical protein